MVPIPSKVIYKGKRKYALTVSEAVLHRNEPMNLILDRTLNEFDDLRADVNHMLSLDLTNGKSPYELAQLQGYSGTLDQWLASLVGPVGTPGKNGTNGTNGKDADMTAVNAKLKEFDDRISEMRFVQELTILNGTVAISGNSTLYVPISLPATHVKYDLRTIHAANITSTAAIRVRLAEVNNINSARYISLEKNTIDDILSYPFYDSTKTGKVHIWIENKDSSNIQVEYELRILDLL